MLISQIIDLDQYYIIFIYYLLLVAILPITAIGIEKNQVYKEIFVFLLCKLNVEGDKHVLFKISVEYFINGHSF
jgi:hypothetical protein